MCSLITTTVTGHIERCRSRHRRHDGRLQRCRYVVTPAFCAAIVSAVSFTSMSWRRDEVSTPYTIGPTHGGLRPEASIDGQLLPQCQVLEDQTAVLAREDDQQPNSLTEPGDHGSG